MESSTSSQKQRKLKWNDTLSKIFIEIIRENKVHILSAEGDTITKWKRVTEQFNNHPIHTIKPNVCTRTHMNRYSQMRVKARNLIHLNPDIVKMLKEIDEEVKQDNHNNPHLYYHCGGYKLLDDEKTIRKKNSRPEFGYWTVQQTESFLGCIRETKAHLYSSFQSRAEYTNRWGNVSAMFQDRSGTQHPGMTAEYCARRFTVIRNHVKRMYAIDPSYKPSLVRFLMEMDEEMAEHDRMHPNSRSLFQPIVRQQAANTSLDNEQPPEYDGVSSSSELSVHTSEEHPYHSPREDQPAKKAHTSEDHHLPEDDDVFRHAMQMLTPPETSSPFSLSEEETSSPSESETREIEIVSSSETISSSPVSPQDTTSDPIQQLIRKIETMIGDNTLDDEQIFVFMVLFDTPLRQNMMIFPPNILGVWLKGCKLDDDLLNLKSTPKTQPSDEESRLYFQNVDVAYNMGFITDRGAMVSTRLFDYETYREKALLFSPRMFGVWLERVVPPIDTDIVELGGIP